VCTEFNLTVIVTVTLQESLHRQAIVEIASTTLIAIHCSLLSSLGASRSIRVDTML